MAENDTIRAVGVNQNSKISAGQQKSEMKLRKSGDKYVQKYEPLLAHFCTYLFDIQSLTDPY